VRINLSPARRQRMKAEVKELALFMKEVVSEFLTDNCPHLAASISYYVLLCLFPLALAAISILGILSNNSGIENKVIEAIGDVIPVSRDFIASTIQGVSNNWGATGTVAIIGLLWGGSAVFGALRKSLNAAWGIRTPRPFFVERFMELGMMLGVGLLLLVSFGMTAAVSIIQRLSNATVGGLLGGDIFWDAVLVLLTTALAFVTFLMLYKFIPNTKVRWSDVWGGALLAAIGFEAAKHIFIWYAAEYNDYNLIYGTMGTLIALLVWTYVSANILLFCAKLTSVYSRHRVSTPKHRTWKGRRKISNRIQTHTSLPQYDASRFAGTNIGARHKSEDD